MPRGIPNAVYPEDDKFWGNMMRTVGRWWRRVRRVLCRIRGPYARWSISRWETPVSDIDRILSVSLCDQDDRLIVTMEAAWEPNRPRWRVTFSRYQAYRNADELHLTSLWVWLDSSGQRCGSTFVVEQSPWIDELAQIRPLRHYVIATLDDVIEVAAEVAPEWEELGPALTEPPLPARSRHLWYGEDNAEIEQVVRKFQSRSVTPARVDGTDANAPDRTIEPK